MAFTVTATESGSSFSHGVALLVRVLTNATEAGGASGGAASTGVTSQGSLTPNFSGSYVAFSISADNVSAMPAAATSNTYDLTTGNGTNVWSTAQGHYSGTVTSGTPLTYGAGSAGSSDHSNWCAYEVPASGGTITLNGSSPAGALSGAGLASGTAATTASFTPPVGSVLVAEVCAGGTGAGAGITMTITDTSGLGLVWTLRAVSSASDNFQPTWVYTTTVPATFTGISTTGRQAMPGHTWLHYFTCPQLTEPQMAPALPVPAYPPQQQAQPGQTWKTRYRLPQRPKPTAPVLPAYIAGLAGGTSGYFVDQNSTPRLFFSAVPWGMPANAGRWNGGAWATDFDQYFAAIKAQGMTAAEMHPWGHSHTGCNNDLGNTWDGVSPWTTLPTLNNTFWQRIDALLNAALNHGITVLLVLNMQCDMGVDAFAGTGVFNGVSAANVQTACQNIAARYVNQPNLIFFQGDDYNNDDDTRMQAMVNGLHAGGYAGPTGTEEYSSGTTSRRDLSGSPTGTPFTFGGANSTFNWCYYYAQTYFAVEQAYKENNQIPVIWGDGTYVGGGAGEPADTHLMRNFVWWALASGARGVSMGSEVIHPWPSGVFTLPVDGITTNVWYNTEAKNVYTAFTSLTGWHLLLPDLASALVTAGRGSRSGYSVTNFQAANLGTDNYVAASITPDGSLAVIYCAVAMSITIDQTKLGSGYTATWLDPASGATTSATPGSTYNSTPLGNNAAGNPDWVLVLQGPALPVGGTGTAAIAGAGAVTGAVTQAVTASVAGAGSVTAVATVIVTAAAAGAGNVTAAPVQASGAALAGAGSLTAVTVQAVTAAPSGAGSVTAAAVQAVTAAPAGTGTVTTAVTQIVTATVTGAGSVSAVATVIAGAAAAGAGTVTAVVTEAVPASLAGAGSVVANATGAGTSSGTATITGAGSVTSAVTQAVIAAPAGAGSVTASVAQAATAAAAGAGAVTALAAQIAGASPAGTGSVTTTVTQAATAAAAGTGTVTAVETQAVTASLAGAGSVTAIAASSGAATAAVAGAGSVTAVATVIVTATAAGAGTVTAAVTQPGSASLSGAGSVSASGAITGTASLAGAGSVTAKAVQAVTAAPSGAGVLTALAVQRAIAQLAGAGLVTASGGIQLAFTVGTLTGSIAPQAVLTAASAPGGTAGGTITSGTQRTGGPG